MADELRTTTVTHQWHASRFLGVMQAILPEVLQARVLIAEGSQRLRQIDGYERFTEVLTGIASFLRLVTEAIIEDWREIILGTRCVVTLKEVPLDCLPFTTISSLDVEPELHPEDAILQTKEIEGRICNLHVADFTESDKSSSTICLRLLPSDRDLRVSIPVEEIESIRILPKSES